MQEVLKITQILLDKIKCNFRFSNLKRLVIDFKNKKIDSSFLKNYFRFFLTKLIFEKKMFLDCKMFNGSLCLEGFNYNQKQQSITLCSA